MGTGQSQTSLGSEVTALASGQVTPLYPPIAPSPPRITANAIPAHRAIATTVAAAETACHDGLRRPAAGAEDRGTTEPAGLPHDVQNLTPSVSLVPQEPQKVMSLARPIVCVRWAELTNPWPASDRLKRTPNRTLLPARSGSRKSGNTEVHH